MLRMACAALVAAVAPAVALSRGSSAVVDLTPENFDKLVIKDDGVWMVAFTAPWCGHCKNLQPEYKKLADATKGVVNVGNVDADQHKSLGSKYGVQGFPTIKIFSGDKKKPSEYQGQRDAKGMADALMREAKSVVTGRLNGGAGAGNKQKKEKKSESGGGPGGKVVELTEDNFDELVINSDDVYLVAFTAPWCGHCKSLKPAWSEAAAKLAGKVKLGNVDATVHQSLGQRFQVQGFPTIKVFAGAGPGRRDGVPYEGGRSAEDIVSFALQMAPPPKVIELVDPADFKVCETEMCIVTIVPSLYEADANARKSMIKTMKEVAKKNAVSNLNWFWTPAGEQKKLQESLMRGSTAFPATYAMNAVKKVTAFMRSGFDEKTLGKFVVGLTTGKLSTQQLSSLPEVVKTTKWDGKDAAPVAVDEIPLDELFGDDEDDEL